MRRTLLKRPVVAAAVVLLGATMTLSACGSDDASDAGATPEPSVSSTSTTSSGDAAKAPKVTGDFGQKPIIAKPAGDPPTTLVIKDLKVGEGEAVTDISKTYLWNYAGIAWSDGQTFDSSFDGGESVPFALNQVIPGWTEGLIGIKPGGRRQLVIPADLAYGAAGRPGIAPNETLVFVVDLIGPAS